MRFSSRFLFWKSSFSFRMASISDPPGLLVLSTAAFKYCMCLWLQNWEAMSATSSAAFPLSSASLTLSTCSCLVVLVGRVFRYSSMLSLLGLFSVARGLQSCVPMYMTVIILWQRSFSTYFLARHSICLATTLQCVHLFPFLKSTLLDSHWIFL